MSHWWLIEFFPCFLAPLLHTHAYALTLIFFPHSASVCSDLHFLYTSYSLSISFCVCGIPPKALSPMNQLSPWLCFQIWVAFCSFCLCGGIILSSMLKYVLFLWVVCNAIFMWAWHVRDNVQSVGHYHYYYTKLIKTQMWKFWNYVCNSSNHQTFFFISVCTHSNHFY